MYLVGRIILDLAGTELRLEPPSNFFGGVANLLTKGRWSTLEEMETYKLLAFAQSANRALLEAGVTDVLRVGIGNQVIYEDHDKRPDDFREAMRERTQPLPGN